MYEKVIEAKKNPDIMLELINMFNPLILKYSSLLKMDTEDAMSEFTLELIRIINKFPAKDEYDLDMYVLSYIKKSIRNSYISLSKKQTSLNITYLEDFNNIGIEESQLSAFWMNDILLKLTPVQRDVIILKYYHGYTVNEIANIMNISRQAVNQMKKRALKHLKEMLK